MSKIFISHSHLESDYAQRLVDSLEQKGFSVWIDERIDYGTQWPRVIQQHVDECSAFIVIMSPRSYESDWVQNELSRAKRKGKYIFPLLLEGEQWLSVEAIQYVDVRSGNLPLQDFYERLGQVVPPSQERRGKSREQFSTDSAIDEPVGASALDDQRKSVDFDDLFGGQVDFSDFFKTLFDGSERTPTTGTDEISTDRIRELGSDIELDVSIDLEEAYRGTTRTFAHEGGVPFTVKIPPGVKTGTKVRLRGKGYRGADGEGDLFVAINVEPHEMFKREGNDLIATVQLDAQTAKVGGRVDLPSMSGNVRLNIPAGVEEGKTFRLKKKGMPHLRDPKRHGDLLAKIHILNSD